MTKKFKKFIARYEKLNSRLAYCVGVAKLVKKFERDLKLLRGEKK